MIKKERSMDALRACKPTLMDTPNFADPKVRANYEKYPQVRANLAAKGVTYKNGKSYTKKKTTDKVATDNHYRESSPASRVKKVASKIDKLIDPFELKKKAYNYVKDKITKKK